MTHTIGEAIRTAIRTHGAATIDLIGGGIVVLTPSKYMVYPDHVELLLPVGSVIVPISAIQMVRSGEAVP